MVIFRVAKLKLPAREVVLKRQAARRHKASWREKEVRASRRGFGRVVSVWLSALGSLGSRPRRMRTLVQVGLCMQFVETRHTLQASFPIKVQVTIGGWMDGCWLPTAEHRQARERTTRLPSLLATYKAALAKCQPSTALFLRLSRRLAAWPVGGTVYECRVTNRPTGPRETDSVQTLCSNSVRSIPPS